MKNWKSKAISRKPNARSVILIAVSDMAAPGDISAAMIKHSLDPAEIISQGEIAFAEDHAAVFLDLIEQLYYEADFTGEHRRSDRYSPLRH